MRWPDLIGYGFPFLRLPPSYIMIRPQPLPREAYAQFSLITTRWMDNDVYGHVNNVTYYSYFDTAVNRFLIEAGVLDIHDGAVIGLVIETHCNYFAPLAFPRNVEAGIRVAHVGHTSVRYEIGIFELGEPLSAASGHFVHVYVDKQTRRPSPLSERFIDALARLQCPGAAD